MAALLVRLSVVGLLALATAPPAAAADAVADASRIRAGRGVFPGIAQPLPPVSSFATSPAIANSDWFQKFSLSYSRGSAAPFEQPGPYATSSVRATDLNKDGICSRVGQLSSSHDHEHGADAAQQQLDQVRDGGAAQQQQQQPNVSSAAGNAPNRLCEVRERRHQAATLRCRPLSPPAAPSPPSGRFRFKV